MHDETLARELERMIVRYCSPTLCNIKPANLFTFKMRPARKDHGRQLAAARNACDRAARESRGSCRRAGESPSGQSQCLGAHANGRPSGKTLSPHEVQRAIDACARKLAPMGIRIAMLACCANGPLVYVYRPAVLERSFATPEVARLLAREAYRPDSIPACLELLSERLRESLPSHGGACEFPHEIGLFLGYPVEDVIAFMEHGGRDFLCLGCWKAYHDADGAQRTWARYRECTAYCEEMIGRGMAIECIAVPGTFVEEIGALPIAV